MTDLLGGDCPRFWSIGGRSRLLLGATQCRNLFLHESGEVVTELDRLCAAGGNFVRIAMTTCVEDPGLSPFRVGPDGRSDLAAWNPSYWEAFRNFLTETQKRDVVVQVEIWDPSEHLGSEWEISPFNPRNTASYGGGAQPLPDTVDDDGSMRDHPFFRSVPELDEHATVLRIQEGFVGKVLSVCMEFDRNIFSVDSESEGSAEWSAYWSEFIKSRGQASGRSLRVTEIWSGSNLRHARHRNSADHPEVYDFCDASSGSELIGDAQWDACQWLWHRTADPPRPLNMARIVGSEDFSYDVEGCDAENALNTFWRAVVGGCAVACFDESDRCGLGFIKLTAAQIRAARMLEDVYDFSQSKPDSFHALLADRTPNEAFAAQIPKRAWMVFFADGGSLAVRVGYAYPLTVRWLNLDEGRWHPNVRQAVGPTLSLKTITERGRWIALIQNNENRAGA